MEKVTLLTQDVIDNLKKKHEKSESSEPFQINAVIYTDGGSRNNNAGYGVHGYIYTNTPTTTGCGVNGYMATQYGYLPKGTSPKLELFDLKSCTPITGAHPHQQVLPVAYIDALGSLMESTNNVAELVGLQTAVSVLKDSVESGLISQVHFVLDSKYTIGALYNRNTYIENGYVTAAKRPLANVELLKQIYAEFIPLMVYATNWSIEWTKGHSDAYGNILADRHASAGVIAAENQCEFSNVHISPATGYAKSSSDTITTDNPALNTMLDLNWYDDPQFDLDVRVDGMTPLYFGNHSKDEPDKLGQGDPNMTKGVVLVKEVPVSFLELRKFVRKLDRTYNGFETLGPFFGVVNNIVKSNIEKQIKDYGDKLFVFDRPNKCIKSFDDKELLHRINPVGTATAGIQEFSNLHLILDHFLDDKLLPGDCITEVTDTFYETKVNAKGAKTVNTLIGNEQRLEIKVNVNVPLLPGASTTREVLLILTMGVTAPRRRAISSIKDYEPKLYILTRYEPNIGFRHYFIAKINTGEAALWTNTSSNLRLF